ncbi:MAG TPA: pitrilysin family protein [Chryseolinea sp.]|nr:pitrilysin family protein [Chryseolinea sp.]
MLDRTLAPPFIRSTTFDLIKPVKTISENGCEIYFVLGGGQNVCKVELIFPAGRWHENVWGAAYFSAQLLSKGTSQKTSYEIAQLFDHYGAHLEISAGMDFVSVSIYSLNKNLEPSLTLLLELLLDSTFPEKELSQLKSIYLQNLKVNKEKTSFQASVLFRKIMYGIDHPYGKELEEDEVTSLSTDQLMNHYRSFFQGTTIVVSGKVSEAHQQFITDIFGPFSLNGLKHEIAAQPAMPKIERKVVSKDGSVQGSIRMGKLSVGRTDAHYAAVIFLNHILGGYFGSRLMKNIREEKGLSYGISSSISSMLHGNHMAIGADVNLENVDLTFDEIMRELKRLRTEKIDAVELETARNHFIGNLQLEITTSFAHADKVKNLLLFNLPDTFYQDLIQRIDRISADDLLQIGDMYFQEDSFVEVAVG